MPSKPNRGPGRTRRDGAQSTKTAPAAGGVGRYKPPEVSGRYTRPVPTKVRRSARWYGPLILFLFVFAVLMIILNYITVLPGSVSTWYLVGGIAIIAVAFGMATRYR